MRTNEYLWEALEKLGHELLFPLLVASGQPEKGKEGSRADFKHQGRLGLSEPFSANDTDHIRLLHADVSSDLNRSGS